MSDQQKHRHPAESTGASAYEEDVQRVLVAIEQDPYDEDGYVLDFLERWVSSEDVSADEFRVGLSRIIVARAEVMSEMDRIESLAPGSREWLVAQLDLHGADAGSDFNDGIEPNGGRFGWSVERDRITVTFVPMTDEGDADEENAVTREWQLVPVIGDDE